MDTKLKMKQFPFNIVHLSPSNIPRSLFSNKQNCNFIIVKRSSSSYNKCFTSFSREKAPIPSKFPIFIQKPQNLWVASPLDLPASPTILVSQFCQFVSAHDLGNTLHFRFQSYESLLNLFQNRTSIAIDSALSLICPFEIPLILECIYLSPISQLSTFLSFSYVFLQQQPKKYSEFVCIQNKNSSLIWTTSFQYLNHTNE